MDQINETPAADQQPVLNEDHFAALVEQCGEDPEMMLDLWEMFYEDAERDLAAIEALFPVQDYEAFSSLVHNVSGSAANMACTTLHEHCAQLERLAHQEADDASLQAIFVHLRPSLAEVARSHKKKSGLK